MKDETYITHTTKYQPDAAHIFPDFARIGPLQFTQLGAPLDFEIRFVALRCHDLNKEMIMINKKNEQESIQIHLDIDRRIHIFLHILTTTTTITTQGRRIPRLLFRHSYTRQSKIKTLKGGRQDSGLKTQDASSTQYRTRTKTPPNTSSKSCEIPELTDG